MNTPKDLFLHDLSTIYDAERQIAELLPNQANQVEFTPLKDAFRRHERETKQQISNLERCFELLEGEPENAISHMMRGLDHEHQMMVNQDPAPEIAGLFELGSGLKTEHYEIASYEHLIESARSLGESEVVKLLEQNLEQEREMEKNVQRLRREFQQEMKH